METSLDNYSLKQLHNEKRLLDIQLRVVAPFKEDWAKLTEAIKRLAAAIAKSNNAINHFRQFERKPGVRARPTKLPRKAKKKFIQQHGREAYHQRFVSMFAPKNNPA
ncbi:hypothetical protein [Tellurirhabdus bombi]|uniref:hypothetical protein n=1 Tax=Tellurirhabdus bombi TaxID=2907205 RepID=UPI001F20A7CC|nr:hypothetical protein [Tellurirhabdus bombi]